MQRVSVIVVNYRTSALVVDCLHSLFCQTQGVELEVIVVDNDSGEGIDGLLCEHFDSRVRCVMLPCNVGFGMANNAGFEVATGEYLLCLNPDTIVLNNAVKILTDYMASHPEVGACGGNLFDGLMCPAPSFGRVLPGVRWELCAFLGRRICNKLYHGSWDFNHTGHIVQVGYITGADLMIRRAALEQTGGFSSAFFMYYEDTDLCLRLRQGGWKLVCVPEAHIQHLEGGSFAKDGEVRFGTKGAMLCERSRSIYYRKNIVWPKRVLCNLMNGFTLLFYSTLFSLMRHPYVENYKMRIHAHGWNISGQSLRDADY